MTQCFRSHPWIFLALDPQTKSAPAFEACPPWRLGIQVCQYVKALLIVWSSTLLCLKINLSLLSSILRKMFLPLPWFDTIVGTDQSVCHQRLIKNVGFCEHENRGNKISNPYSMSRKIPLIFLLFIVVMTVLRIGYDEIIIKTKWWAQNLVSETKKWGWWWWWWWEKGKENHRQEG